MRHRWREVAPFVVVLGRAVGTEGEHQHVLVVVVVIQSGEIGETAVFPSRRLSP